MKNSGFSFYLIFSIVIHLGFALIFTLTNFKSELFSKKTLIEPSVRIDMIGLPELQKMKSSPKKRKKSVNLGNKKSAIKPKPKSKSTPPKKKQDLKKGNQISEGIEEGTSQKEQLKIVNIYLVSVIGIIKLNWNLPQYLTSENYYTQLEVQINSFGEVTSKKIVASSGNDIFDGHVMKAIELSSPFPPPPPSAQKLISSGIVFGLSSQD